LKRHRLLQQLHIACSHWVNKKAETVRDRRLQRDEEKLLLVRVPEILTPSFPEILTH